MIQTTKLNNQELTGLVGSIQKQLEKAKETKGYSVSLFALERNSELLSQYYIKALTKFQEILNNNVEKDKKGEVVYEGGTGIISLNKNEKEKPKTPKIVDQVKYNSELMSFYSSNVSVEIMKIDLDILIKELSLQRDSDTYLLLKYCTLHN